MATLVQVSGTTGAGRLLRSLTLQPPVLRDAADLRAVRDARCVRGQADAARGHRALEGEPGGAVEEVLLLRRHDVVETAGVVAGATPVCRNKDQAGSAGAQGLQEGRVWAQHAQL